MANQELQGQVNAVLDGYASDEIMLDSFLQWAGNPTSMSASYGLEENDHYVLKNLEVRQGLSLQEAEERVGELRKVCGSLIDWTRRLPIESRRQIWEIQRAPRGAYTSALAEAPQPGLPGAID